jgi:4-amino-4-deoxy-L-arabinose transferase-like glycosyltransferase
MVDSGDFVRIMNGAVPRNRKPIGIHWLQALPVEAARAAGVSRYAVWPYRLASVAGALAAVLATWWAGVTLFGDRRAALAAAAMLAASVTLTVEAHIAKTDAALLGATTLAMAVLARAWRGPAPGAGMALVFWLALGAGILIKGPITPMVAGLTVVALGVLSGRWRWLVALRPGWGLPVMAGVVLPWFFAIGVATHGAFFSDAMGGDLGRKLAGGQESHGGWPGTHLLLLLPLLAFPATAVVLAGLPALWRHRREEAARFVGCWLVPSWLVFEAVPTKLPHYTLPLYPALMLAAGWFATRPGRAAEVAAWWPRVARIIGAAVGGLLAVAALALPAILPGAAVWLGIPAALGAGAAALASLRGNAMAGLFAAIVMYWGILQVELPGLAAIWVSPRVAAALRAAAPGGGADGAGLGAACFAEPSLMFETGSKLAFVPSGEAAADLLASGRAGAVAVEQACLPGFLAKARALCAPVAAGPTVDGVNYSRGRAVSLHIFARTAAQAGPCRFGRAWARTARRRTGR